jgi:hypothetical protein
MPSAPTYTSGKVPRPCATGSSCRGGTARGLCEADELGLLREGQPDRAAVGRQGLVDATMAIMAKWQALAATVQACQTSW